MSNHTSRYCLRQSGLNRRRPRRTPVLKANHKKHEWNLPFSHFLQCHISSDAKIKLIKKMTQRLLWNMEETRLCSWAYSNHIAKINNIKSFKNTKCTAQIQSPRPALFPLFSSRFLLCLLNIISKAANCSIRRSLNKVLHHWQNTEGEVH